MDTDEGADVFPSLSRTISWMSTSIALANRCPSAAKALFRRSSCECHHRSVYSKYRNQLTTTLTLTLTQHLLADSDNSVGLLQYQCTQDRKVMVHATPLASRFDGLILWSQRDKRYAERPTAQM